MRPRQAARLLAGVVVFLACITWLDSPLRSGPARRLQMLGIAPQAWGFFASPREARPEVYRLRNGAWERADTPLGSAANLFGLRKAIVSHGPEFRTLESEVEVRWSTADLAEDQLPTIADDPVEVSNLAREPRLCGEVLLVERPPLPWAWAHAGGRSALPTRYARLTVRC
ncbi:MAG TPA: SdpA family antimicrobial peptide system protein [Myxococcaceae bacterium]|nr:SdpA family antimicrobial peptide system protein [Myxococcaceae bacterium]